MNVENFIKWLETKPKHLEVCVIALDDQHWDNEVHTDIQSVTFDDPVLQSTETSLTLTLGGY